MITTARITSGFDIEYQLGGGWFQTALNDLAERGLLIPPGTIPFLADDAQIQVTAVTIVFAPADRDLDITLLLGGLIPFVIGASIAISEDGSELTLVHTLDDVPVVVPFAALTGLAGAPILVKRQGDDEHENVMAVLANLDLRATDQNSTPLPAGEHLERGDPAAAQSFLPLGKHVVLGFATESLQRFGNDIWHDQLTDDEGNQPFPDADDQQGNWRSVSMAIVDGRIRVTLRAVAEVDTPLIDIIPDPDVTITVDLIPSIVGGRLQFEVEVDASIDFGLLGDLLAGLIGGLIGFIVGLFTGNPIGGAVTGATLGIVVLEIGEYVAGKVIAKEIQAEIDGQPTKRFFSCKNDVVHRATVVVDEDGLSLGFLDALPTSVPIHSDNPDPLYERTIAISSDFDEITANAAGFAVAGATVVTEINTPVDAMIVGKTTDGGELTALVYRTDDGTEHTLPLSEVLDRANDDAVPEPLNVVTDAEGELEEHKQPGRVPIACMHPVAIHREKTIITAIRFDTGLELDTQDTVRLQDGGALLLPQLQLIHPSSGRPYYRAAADDSIDNNFESLPEF